MSEQVDLGWSVVEMLGHRVIAGFVTEVEIAGSGFLRVDLWAEDGAPRTSQFVAPASVYCITPTTEEAVRERMKPRPIHRFALPDEIVIRDDFDEDDDEPGF
jgi:hypothetical protein